MADIESLFSGKLDLYHKLPQRTTKCIRSKISTYCIFFRRKCYLCPMRVRIYTYWLGFIVAALFAVIFNSCKSPNAPSTPSPTSVLSLTLPDSARVFDTVTFRAHYSDSIHTGWKFEWQFGDSSKASTKDTTISHVYDSAGTYTVLVSLVDSNGMVIAKDSATIQVVARHFNLALLQSMKYVDYYNYGTTFGTTEPNGSTGGSWSVGSGKLLTWKGMNFSYDTSYHYYGQFTAGRYTYRVDSGNWGSSISGSIDSLRTHIILFEEMSSTISRSFLSNGEDLSQSSGDSNFSVSDVPFIYESDSDVVFKSTGRLINASDGTSSSSQLNGNFSAQSSTEVWSDPNSRIVVRFHK